jgi:hypothetical protein
MSGISGVSETWLIELHDSFASLKNLDQSLSALLPVHLGSPAASADDN